MTTTDGTHPTTRRIRPLMRRMSADHVQLARPPAPLPVQGSSSGWIVRRDQALVALTAAGLTGPVVSALTVGCVRLGTGEVLVHVPGESVDVRVPGCPDGHAVCGACAVHRWVRALELSVQHTDPWVIPAILARAPALTASAQHDCLPGRSVDPAVVPLMLLPAIDQWGPVPSRASTRSSAGAGRAVPSAIDRRTRPGQTFPGP